MLAARTSLLRSSSAAARLRTSQQHFPSTLILIGHSSRFYSTPTSTTATSESSSLPPPSANGPRKPKVELRPGPVKPPRSSQLSSTESATRTPVKPTVNSNLQPKTEPSPTPSLAEVKNEAVRDIELAEAHGVLKPPPPDANWFKKTLHKGIELAKFYYRGVKLIWIRRGHISAIYARIQQGGAPLTRAENRLIRTQKQDVTKVIPFLFIALLLEEVIPLIAIYAPSTLPSTCILPSQQERIQEKLTDKTLSLVTEHRNNIVQLKELEAPKGHIALEKLAQAGAATVICGALRLSTIGIDALRVRRIRKHLQFLAVDDGLIPRDSLQNFSERDLVEALQERGLLTQGLSKQAMQSRLKWWLESVGDSSDESRRLQLLVSRL